MKSVRIALYVCLPIVLAAQPPAFEVVSIKPSNYQGGPLRIIARVTADGIDFSNVTPRLCIQRAYGVKPYQLTGPEWISTERYMIVAKAAGAIPEDKILLMLQTLLTERFKLAIHREAKEMPVYALVQEWAKTRRGHGRGSNSDRFGWPRNGIRAGIHGATAGTVSRGLDRPVVDVTGLGGLYSFKLLWASDRPSRPAVAAAGLPEPTDPEDAPSIFTALQERLGLRLEPRKAPVDVLVIDHIEKPSSN